MRKNHVIGALCLSAAIILLFPSCDKGSYTTNVESENMFSMNYGSFEDETKLFSISQEWDYQSDIYMRDGFFYVSDSHARKIMMFNSYGDLLSVYYNPSTNPVPSFIQFSEIESAETGTSSRKATQQATAFSFRRPEHITVDSRKYLYVSDYIPEERYETDADGKQMLRQVVHRFDSEGNYIDYIGQQGLGGSPFPLIKNIYTTVNNDFVVICENLTGYVVFWYSSEGFLEYKVPVSFNSLPVPESLGTKEIMAAVSGIVPDTDDYRLYILIDYSRTEYDESSKIQSGIVYCESLLYPMNLSTGKYETAQVIPPYEQIIVNDLSRQTYTIPYEFLGITESGWFFFMNADSEGCSLQMVNPDGQRILTRKIKLDVNQLKYYRFALSGEGIISALQAGESAADVTWWRTDKIINALQAGK